MIRILKNLMICAVAISLYPQHIGAVDLKVARIFSDHMVLQQNKDVPIWGWALPGDSVFVQLNGKSYATCTDSKGKWIIRLDPQRAGGPYQMEVRCNTDKKFFKDILFGEVWLASGQSNMNYRVENVLQSDKVIQEANYPMIREFCTPNDVSRIPCRDLKSGEWKTCNPENVGNYSAVAYFFARALHLDQKVPVGIIHTSWSGTRCESWISAEALTSVSDYRERVKKEVIQSKDDWADLHNKEMAKDAERERIVATSRIGEQKGVHLNHYNDKNWASQNYPFYLSRHNLRGYRLIWLRKTIELSQKDICNDLTLHLGKMATADITYFNGKKVGTSKRDGIRSYKIPSKILKAGKNIIAIRLLSEWGNGHLGDEASSPFLYSADKAVNIPLKGQWKYNAAIEPKLPEGKGYQNHVTCMYNAKIAPLLPYAIRGFLWYQGEGNSGNYEQYKQLQPTLISDWRIRFQQGYLPFLFVQLPNYGHSNKFHLFREAQAESLNQPYVGMAVTIDLGDPYDVHYPNKQPVGERLYLRAKEIAYNERNGVFEGPVYDSYQLEGKKIRINFKRNGSKLISKDGKPLRHFEIADSTLQYVNAQAIIDGNSVIVWNENILHPIAVRYAWTSNPNVNLYNKEGIPATTFRTHKE